MLCGKLRIWDLKVLRRPVIYSLLLVRSTLDPTYFDLILGGDAFIDVHA